MQKEYVLTLIAPAGTLLHAPTLVSSLPTVGEHVWLHEDRNQYLTESTAMDIFLSRDLNEFEKKAVAAACEAGEWDYVLQPVANREKKLLISDMDSTMIQNECIDEMARKAGKFEEVQQMTKSGMANVNNDFATSLKRRLALIPGVTRAELDDIRDHVLKPMPGAATLIATMKKRGATTHLVSGGFTHFSEKVAEMLGFDTHNANALEIKDDAITGHLIGEIIDKDKKKALLEQYAAQCNVPLNATFEEMPRSATLAVGDGSNDVPMLRAAGLGIAYHAASEDVRKKAHASITHNDLTALLYAQGIAHEKWVWREPQQVNGKSGAFAAI